VHGSVYSSFIDFQVWDFPGQIDFFDPTFDLDSIFGEMGALIFVIDAVVFPGYNMNGAYKIRMIIRER